MNQSIIFFGTSRFSVIVLDTLRQRGIIPTAIVTTPDKPQGRKLLLTPPPAKVWALEHNIPVLQFEKLDATAEATLKELQPAVFIVASYGKIIPQNILDIPEKGSLNVHPSLLPQYRGASPLQSAILADDQKTGVTIIQMDALMDHGPIVAIKEADLPTWPMKYSALEETLAIQGAHILADSFDAYLTGTISLQPQDDSLATFTKKITKEDGLISVDQDRSPEEQYKDYLKVRAFEGWPGTYFFTERHGKQIRVKVLDADFIEGVFIPTRVIPEGGKEMKYEDFVLGL